MEVLILLDVKDLDKKEIFEAYIKKEGFLVIERGSVCLWW